MNIAVLGGGTTGLATAHYLSKKGDKITIFEKEPVLGGMSSSFKDKNWQWPLEKTYHHFFSNDQELIGLMKETNFKNYFFRSPETASLYNISRMFPVDTPQDFLKLPLLPLLDKLRAGLVVFFLKASPFFPFYEKQTAETFLRKTMGERAWISLWQELFRKKFGKNAGNILASFIWARIKKRTKKLGYMNGGFQSFIDHLEITLEKKGVVIKKEMAIKNIEKKNKQFVIWYGNDQNSNFDMVVSTLPTPILIKVGENLFPKDYLLRLKKIKYLHGTTLILQTGKPLFEKTYWVNVNDKKLPFMVLVQHTNYIDNTYYGGQHILYIGDYVDSDNKLLRMSAEEMVKYFLPYLKKINPNYGNDLKTPYFFKTYHAQPIFDKEFLKNKPEFTTPIKNFYIANLDMTYPYDRGTNYAVATAKNLVEKYF